MTPLSVLLIVTSADRMGCAPGSTGYWLEEVAAPYYVFSGAGYTVHIASPKGGTPPRDPESDKPEHKGADSRRFEEDAEASRTLAGSLRLSAVRPADYAAAFFAGGHGTMTDFPSDPGVIRIVEAFAAGGKPVASLCHGPACLVGAKDAVGNPLIKGKRFTCFTDEEEKAARADTFVPFSLQTTLRRLGGIFYGGPAFAPRVVTDGVVITGQNPASSAGAAEAVVTMLANSRPCR